MEKTTEIIIGGNNKLDISGITLNKRPSGPSAVHDKGFGKNTASVDFSTFCKGADKSTVLEIGTDENGRPVFIELINKSGRLYIKSSKELVDLSK